MIFSRDKKLKIICSLAILLGICLVPFTNVSAPPVQAGEEPRVAPINPDFLEFWENPPEHFYGYIPPPTDLSHLSEIPVQGAKTLAALPTSFDWRDQGKVTSVKNQNPCGTCWVHGTLAAVESKVLIEESTTYDFSEQNLACCTDPAWVYLIGNRCMGGGWSWLAADTLTKKGTRLEECDPYNTSTINIETCDDSCQTIKMITDYRLIANEASTSAAITPIKNAIYNHGPLAMSYHADDDDSHLYPGNIYYWPDCPQPANHLVCIVGWDDSIAWPDGAGSGAWIVKNSWGTGWGGNGYFYLCYGSASMCEVASLNYKDYDANEKIYYWDEAGKVFDFGNWSDYSGWMASMFTSSQDGSLTHVDFWTSSNNAQYEIYVYLDGNISDGLQNLATSQSGTCQESGYYSISLTSPVSLTNGQSFIIAVKMTTPGYSYPIPVEYQLSSEGDTICNPTIQTNKSFFRHGDAESWTDIATEGCNACLRGRVTTGVAGQPDITVTPAAFDETLPPNTTQDYTLTISNTGDATLTYSISDRDITGPTAPAGVRIPALPTGEIRQRQGLIELNPSRPMSFPTLPTAGSKTEIAYDDGKADDAWYWYYAGGGFAVRFTPPEYPVALKTARFCFWPEYPDADHEQFGVEVYDDDGAGGAPGTLLGGGTTTASDWGWCDVDISSLGITITSGDFYIAYEQLTNYPDCEALCADYSSPDGRSWSWDDWFGEWSLEEIGDWMIRCVVEVGEANNPPTTPSNPCPANHATSVSVDADLSWTGGDPDAGDTVTYDVYFGTGASPALVSNDQPATSYDPGTLNNDTKYYWKIVATDNHAAPTSGPVWDFTTGGAVEDCPWLDESPISGSVTPGNSDSITVTIDTTGLAEGDYSAEIVIANNDPNENPTIVPVALHVSGVAPATAERSIDPDSVSPGGTTTVSVTITANQTLNGFALDEELPADWTLAQVDNAGAIFTPAEVSWVWVVALLPGQSKTVVYQLMVPATAAEGTYNISGLVMSSGIENIEVGGEDTITVTEEAGPWSYDEDGNGYIEIDELLHAISDYIGGEITISDLLEIISLYIGHTPKP